MTLHPAPPRVCMSIQFEAKSCSDVGQVLVLNDPPDGRAAVHDRGNDSGPRAAGVW
jgi:hypothetical protein